MEQMECYTEVIKKNMQNHLLKGKTRNIMHSNNIRPVLSQD